MRDKVRGEYRFSSLMKQKTGGEICFVIYIAGFFFLKIFCYEVFAKQKKKRCSTTVLHVSADRRVSAHSQIHTRAHTHLYDGLLHLGRHFRRRRICSQSRRSDSKEPSACRGPRKVSFLGSPASALAAADDPAGRGAGGFFLTKTTSLVGGALQCVGEKRCRPSEARSSAEWGAGRWGRTGCMRHAAHIC